MNSAALAGLFIGALWVALLWWTTRGPPPPPPESSPAAPARRLPPLPWRRATLFYPAPRWRGEERGFAMGFM